MQLEIKEIEAQWKPSKAQYIPKGLYSDEQSPAIEKSTISVWKYFCLGNGDA